MDRYARQKKLNNIGESGQEKILATSVLIVGVGGLGCPVSQYLAGAGIGKIGLVDGDLVDITNLHRQILFTENSVGKNKASEAAKLLTSINSEIEFVPYPFFIDDSNAIIVEQYDLIVDCTDNVISSEIINDACLLYNKPWVYGGVHQYQGQITVFNYLSNANYRELFGRSLLEQPSCTDQGVLGTIPGVIGGLMANEVFKIILENGIPLANKLLTYDFLRGTSFTYDIQPNKLTTIEPSTIKNISPSELKLVIDHNKYLLIDVRESEEIEISKIDDSLVTPLSEFNQYIPLIVQKNLPVVAYCHHGIRSMKALSILREHGLQELYNLTGGIDRWALEIDPQMKRY